MTQLSVTHATFVIDRLYDAQPTRVFAAWATKEAKARWFACHGEWKTSEFTLDFRIGGKERVRTGPPGGTVHGFDGTYHDIVPDQRIVYAYAMHLDETRISVSLATVEFRPEGRGTRLVFTEQGAFLDGYDDVAGREHGTRIGLDNLEAALKLAPRPPRHPDVRRALDRYVDINIIERRAREFGALCGGCGAAG